MWSPPLIRKSEMTRTRGVRTYQGLETGRHAGRDMKRGQRELRTMWVSMRPGKSPGFRYSSVGHGEQWCRVGRRGRRRCRSRVCYLGRGRKLDGSGVQLDFTRNYKTVLSRFPPLLRQVSSSFMPSLRRSFSSPSVRSSPYPSSLSTPTPNPSIIRARATAPHPRRSSGSATAERRVLADIEWWRVHDGQCDLDLQDQFQEDVQAPDGDVPLSGTVMLSAGGGSLEPPQTPLSLHSFWMDSMQVRASVSSPRSHADRHPIVSPPKYICCPIHRTLLTPGE